MFRSQENQSYCFYLSTQTCRMTHTRFDLLRELSLAAQKTLFIISDMRQLNCYLVRQCRPAAQQDALH
jgi:hypothetical protein